MDTYSFLSYAHKDWQLIEPYYSALRKQGHNIWYDERIVPGTEWVETIAKNLKGSSSCLLFLSPDSLASANVRREIHYAVANHIPIIIIMLKSCELTEGLKLELSESTFVYPEKSASFEACILEIETFINKANNEAISKRSVKTREQSSGILKNLLFLLTGAALSTICIGLIYFNHLRHNNSSLAAFVKEYYKIVNEGGEDNYKLLWDKYLSKITKTCGFITEEEWLDMNRSKAEDHGFQIISYDAISAKTLPDNIIALKSRIKYQADSEIFTTTSNEYVIIEDGSYRYLVDGVLNVQHFEGGETNVEGVSIKNIEVKECAENLLVNLDIINETGQAISLGSKNNPYPIIIDTEKGSYTEKTEVPFKFMSGHSYTIENLLHSTSGRVTGVFLNQLKLEGNDKYLTARLVLPLQE